MSTPGPPEPSREPEGAPRLVRAIGRWDLTAAIVNGVIGSAIFGMPAAQAHLTGQWSPLVALLAGLGVLTIVLCFAEVASRFREAGGPYLYAREAFGPFVGFQAGWLTFWIRATAVAASLNIFVEYLARLLPAFGGAPARAATMTAVLGIIVAVNLVGVRQATWTVDLFTVAKLLPLGLLILLGVSRIDSEVLATQAVADPDWAKAILLLMFAYGGFEAPLIPAAEARDPKRDSGFALLTALSVVAAVYLLVQLVVIGVVPNVGAVDASGVARDRAPLATAFRVLLGDVGVTVASLAAMLSTYGYATGSVLQAPRVLFSMADRGELPRAFARVHPRFRTPHVSILTFAVVVLALALAGSFAWNATLSAIVRLVTYGLTCAALIVFRRRLAEPPGFRVPGGTAVAVAGVAFCLVLLSKPTLAQAVILVALMVVGALAGWAARAGRAPGPAA
jgi:basic amino acid/polyamine antiporter, APA family